MLAQNNLSFLVRDGTIHLNDLGLEFSPEFKYFLRLSQFKDLRNVNYGEGFRMPIMSELVPFIYTCFQNQDDETARKVINSFLKPHKLLVANTGVLYTAKGMFVQDNPKMKGTDVNMTQKILESKLGATEEGGIIFSNDRTVRFTVYDQNNNLALNRGSIALTGSLENAAMFAELAKDMNHGMPEFWVISKEGLPRRKLNRLQIKKIIHSNYYKVQMVFNQSGSSEYNLSGRGTFGVRKSKLIN